MSSSIKHFYEFGPFRLDVANRLLLREDEPLPLTPKAVETLLALVRHGGEVLRKDDLMRQVWPGQFVEEGNLTQHIYLLRKTLRQGTDGRSYIETLPRRGYRFVGEVRESQAAAVEMIATERLFEATGEEAGSVLAKSFDDDDSSVSQDDDSSVSQAASDFSVAAPRLASSGRRWQAALLFLLVTASVVSVAAFFYTKFSREQKAAGAEAAVIESPGANQAYAKGRYYFGKGTTPALEDAARSFQQTLDQDPNNALAYAGLSDTYAALSERYDMSQRLTDALPRAKEAAARALQLNAQLGEGHAALAVVQERFDFDWSGAASEFKRAIELKPDYAYAHQQYASHLAAMGRLDEAKVEIGLAHQLEPQSFSINQDFAEIFSFAGDYGAATEHLLGTLAADSSDPQAAALRRALGWIYEARGMHDEAVTEFLEALRLSNGNPERLTALRRAYDATGMKGFWRKWLGFRQDRIKLGAINPFYLAEIYAVLGDKDTAFEYLGKALDDRSLPVAALRFRPVFNELRSDKRYAVLFRRVGLAD